VIPGEDVSSSCYLAEWYTGQSDDLPITHVAQCLRRSLAAIDPEAHPPQLLYAVAVPQDAYMFGVFTADSAELVTRACRQAGLPADRVTAATQMPPTIPFSK
jgi:hypothetical protein